jgi:hypothetical protein
VVGETVATILLDASRRSLRHRRPSDLPGLPACEPRSSGADRRSGERHHAQDHLQLHGERQEAITYEHALTYQESFDAAISHFVRALRTGEPFETSTSDNLETLRLVEAVSQEERAPR